MHFSKGMGVNFDEMFGKRTELSRIQKLQYWVCVMIQVLGHQFATRSELLNACDLFLRHFLNDGAYTNNPHTVPKLSK
jgi:hypothetical protein